MYKAFINIPQPCAESWAVMTPAGTGRHCASCKKTVVDFSQKSTAEILAYLTQPGYENACGRFRAGQVAQMPRLINWQAAPRLAASLVIVLTLTHCRPDVPVAAPSEVKTTAAAQDGQLVRGRVLDRTSRQPLVGALIICEADTLCQTRTVADGSFALVVPARLAGSKLIAALPEKPPLQQVGDDWLMPYVPHYFTAGADVTVLLRRPPMIIGQTKLEAGETQSPLIAQYLIKCAALPPRPQRTTIVFTPPAAAPSY